MKTIAIANQAGSAGKTTTTVTLGGLLADEGAHVLIIDADAQANATAWLGGEDTHPTIGEVLLRQAQLDEAVLKTGIPGLHLVPAGSQLDGQAVELGRVLGGEQRLRTALESLDDQPDVVLIDCPGALSILTIAGLVAADLAVTVAQPTIKELAGVPRIEATVAEVRDAYRPGLALAAVVPCIVPPAAAGAVYSEALGLLQDEFGDLVTPPVRRSVRVPEAYAQQAPLHVHGPREAVTQDYRAVLAHLRMAGVL